MRRLGDVTVQLDEAQLGTLDRLVERTGRSRDGLVSQAVEEYVAYNSWAMDKIEAGLAAADAGDFASEADIERVRSKFAQRG